MSVQNKNRSVNFLCQPLAPSPEENNPGRSLCRALKEFLFSFVGFTLFAASAPESRVTMSRLQSPDNRGVSLAEGGGTVVMMMPEPVAGSSLWTLTAAKTVLKVSYFKSTGRSLRFGLKKLLWKERVSLTDL